jgi:hypothetical protein
MKATRVLLMTAAMLAPLAADAQLAYASNEKDGTITVIVPSFSFDA